MPANNPAQAKAQTQTRPALRPLPRRAARQAGATAVEFALLAVIFFTCVCGIVEVTRLLFVYNTLHEVTRRAALAAVNVYPLEADNLDKVRQYAIFRDTPGDLLLANPVTDESVRLDYLRHDLAVIPPTSWPASAAANRQLCMINARAPNCIRFVQASICDPANAGQCNRVVSDMLVPLVNLRVPLHRATTILPVESLGYVPGTPPPLLPCPCS